MLGIDHDPLQRLGLWLERLTADDEDARFEAGNMIARQGCWVLPYAIAWTKDPQPRLREIAAYILGQTGYPHPRSSGFILRDRAGVPTLVRLMESDPDLDVRETAVYALKFIEDESTIPALCRLADDPSERIRLAVATALGSFFDTDWMIEPGRSFHASVIGTLLRLMDDPDDDVRDWATFGLRHEEHDTPYVRARLWRALDDPNADVRGEAASALAGFGDRSLIPRLDQLLREDPGLSSCLFEAAQELADLSLFDAVQVGAERWRADMEEGEELHWFVTAALEAYERLAADSSATDPP